MPVQFPTLDIQTQIARAKDLADNTLFPYSFSIQLTAASASYPTADGTDVFGGTMSYNTIPFQADNTMGIYAIQFMFSGVAVFPASGVSGYFPLGLFAADISYSKAFVISPNTLPFSTPAVPGDTGNTIFRYTRMFSVPQPSTTTGFYDKVNDIVYERYDPNNYLLKYNQFLYIHFGINSALITMNNSFFYLTVVLHMRPTGQKT